jgi:hypothetical protein
MTLLPASQVLSRSGPCRAWAMPEVSAAQPVAQVSPLLVHAARENPSDEFPTAGIGVAASAVSYGRISRMGAAVLPTARVSPLMVHAARKNPSDGFPTAGIGVAVSAVLTDAWMMSEVLALPRPEIASAAMAVES